MEKTLDLKLLFNFKQLFNRFIISVGVIQVENTNNVPPLQNQTVNYELQIGYIRQDIGL